MSKPSIQEITQLPIIDKRMACSTCIGPAACCKAGIELPLTNQEAESLQADGSNMQRLDVAEHPGRNPGRKKAFYRFLEDCVHLTEEGQCDAYETRPAICRQLPVGNIWCQVAQIKQGAEVETLPDSSTRIILPVQAGPSQYS